MRVLRRLQISRIAVAALLAASAGTAPGYELGKDQVCYIVTNAHFDIEYKWTLSTSIRSYLPNTLKGNFQLFQKYPQYILNFEAAKKYMLAKQYYPTLYESLKNYVKSGNIRPAGGMVEASDVNLPSPESLMRQFLYGNGFFYDEFGKRSSEVFLPDCFGFGYALPTIAAHCGIKGFISSKLEWGAYIPFPIGMWEGVDGSSLISILKPGRYNNSWAATPPQISRSDLKVSCDFFGTGDIGGANPAADVESLLKRIGQNGSNSLKLVSDGIDKVWDDFTPVIQSRLPRYRGELLMTVHGVGTYTSRPDIKRRNRLNERYADLAERLSVMASVCSGFAYPQDKLYKAWIRVLWRQHHDGITGTSLPAAYPQARIDYDSSLNDFKGTAGKALTSLSEKLDTRVTGIPVVVANPLALNRVDIAEADVQFGATAPAHIRVFGPDGKEVPSQRIATLNNGSVRIAFVAHVPSVGVAVYDVRPSDTPCPIATGLAVTDRQLSNAKYRVTLDNNGDIASIYDLLAKQELLSAPMRLPILRDDDVTKYAAWEITWAAITAKPLGYPSAPQFRIAEQGPARVALEVVRTYGKSQITQTVQLCADSAGKSVVIKNKATWLSHGTLVKAAFPLEVSNSKATFDLGLGVIERSNRTSSKYEVPAQQWVDMSTTTGSYGVTMISDCNHGWDKPDDRTLRLSVLRIPGHGWRDEPTDDVPSFELTNHEYAYALYGHSGDWRNGSINAAAQVNHPLWTQQVSAHAGNLGNSFSFLSVQGPIAVMAVKKAEKSGKIVVRVRETNGSKAQGARISFTNTVADAMEVTGDEQLRGSANIDKNSIVFDINGYQPKSFLVSLAEPISTPATSWANAPGALPFTVQYGAKALQFKCSPATVREIQIYSANGALLAKILHDGGKRIQIKPLGASGLTILRILGDRGILAHKCIQMN